ncbi:winged helix-turn-helix domain-containing protein [Halopelagius fulvigenes]|uniref:Winged helix-turn-helix domain-containing protein n=1 Tax=Halopelagius fulvigenes TaxID=1198324 RepID=A0ABD5U0D6_9EURY
MGEESGDVGILDALGDEEARRLLASVSERPRSAKDLATEHDLSLPTVYRRLELLIDTGLASSQMFVTEEGGHYKVYEASFRRAVVDLDDGEYGVRLGEGDGAAEPVGADAGDD